jgi:hypothetical protein
VVLSLENRKLSNERFTGSGWGGDDDRRSGRDVPNGLLLKRIQWEGILLSKGVEQKVCVLCEHRVTSGFIHNK